MKFRVAICFAAAFSMAIITSAGSVSAQLPGYDYGVGFGYGFRGIRSARVVNNYDIPYFALHPPVYYSGQITPRPYGVSPFAAPAGIRPVELDMAVKPKTIMNPFVVPAPAAPDAVEVPGPVVPAEEPAPGPIEEPAEENPAPAEEAPAEEAVKVSPSDKVIPPPKKEAEPKSKKASTPQIKEEDKKQKVVFIKNPFYKAKTRVAQK